MAAVKSINIRFVNIHNDETTKSVALGTKVKDLIDTSKFVAILNGEEVTGDIQLRASDVLEEQVRSGKAGC